MKKQKYIYLHGYSSILQINESEHQETFSVFYYYEGEISFLSHSNQVTSCTHTWHRETHPKVMFGIVEEEPDFSVAVGQEHFLQGDHIWVFQFS